MLHKDFSKTTPYPSSLLNQTRFQNFLKVNGYAKLSQELNIKVLYKKAEIKEIWNDFTPKKSVFDLWEVREAFYDAYKFEPYFLTLYKPRGKSPNYLAVLPLWLNSDKQTLGDDSNTSDAGKYVWYGSNWPEDNKFFVKDLDYIPLLLTAAPDKLILSEINDLPEYKFLYDFPGYSKIEEKKYFLDLSKFKTLDDYLLKLKKKKRYNLKRDRKRISFLKPEIIYNTSSYLEDLFNLSIKRFRELFPDEPDEHSAFEDERRKDVFRNLLTKAGNYQTRVITTKIKGVIEAVEFGLVFNKTYYALNAGADISSYSGIGVFSNLLVIEDAINLGCTKVDFLEGDNNWKESWHLDHRYQYQFKK